MLWAKFSNGTSLIEILAGNPDEDAIGEGPLGCYAEVTPSTLVVLNLRDRKEQLERWKAELLWFAQSAMSVCLAM